MNEMMVGYVFMAVYVPMIMAYMNVTDDMMEKFADKVYDWFAKKFSEVKMSGNAGDYVAMFGEAVDA
jgi:hypothetical protein